VGTASPPVRCRCVWQWWCRVRMFCCWLVLSVFKGLGPMSVFGVWSVAPLGGSLTPPAHGARQAFRWESRSARHSPHHLRILTCVPDTECGLKGRKGSKASGYGTPAACVAARVPSAASQAWLFRMGAGGQHPHTVLLRFILHMLSRARWQLIHCSGIRILSSSVAARVPSAASRAWLFRMGVGGQHPHTVLLFICTSTVRVQFGITSTCIQCTHQSCRNLSFASRRSVPSLAGGSGERWLVY
jgi:hypothetical protein